MLSNKMDFIEQFWPERSEHWQEIDSTDAKILLSSRLLNKKFETDILCLAEKPEIVKKYLEHGDEIKLYLKYPEHCYDVIFLEEFYEKFRDSVFKEFESKYDFIFENPEKYRADIKPLKNIRNFYKRILEHLPKYYSLKDKNNTDIFGSFIVHANNIVFQSKCEEIRFSQEQMLLIPAFIKFRNENLMKFILQERSIESKILSSW